MAAIDIGAAATVRGSNFSAGDTYIALDNPANLSGKITSVEIYAVDTLLNCEVAIFYKTDGDVWSTRATVAIGTVDSGAIRTFPVDLDVQAGDYIGITYTGGAIYKDSAGGASVAYAAGDQIPCTDVTFNAGIFVDDVMSLYGTGEELPAGWTGKISGVTNPAKIMGVDVANIAKVKGVT